MPDDLTELCNKLTARIAARLPKGVDVKPEALTHAILGTVIREIAKRDSRAQRAEKERDQLKAILDRAHDAVRGVRAGVDRADKSDQPGLTWFGHVGLGDIRHLLNALDGIGLPDEPNESDIGWKQQQALRSIVEALCAFEVYVTPDVVRGIVTTLKKPGEITRFWQITLDGLANRASSLNQESEPVRWNVCPDCFDSHPGGAACYEGTDQPPELCGDMHSEGRLKCTLPKHHAAHQATGHGTAWEQYRLPETLTVAVECVLLDHHKELDGDEVDANLAELAYVYQQLTGWKADEEIAQDQAALARGDR